MLHLSPADRARERLGIVRGTLTAIRGPVVSCRLPCAAMGDLCTIARRGGPPIPAQVIGFSDESVTLAPLEEPDGIAAGCEVINTAHPLEITLRLPILGSVLDALGKELQFGDATLSNGAERGLIQLNPFAAPPSPLARRPIADVLTTGVRSVDTFCTIGEGQRLGLFATAGSGKSTLLGMLARNCKADVNVVALIGERGREVGEFLQQVVSPEVRRRSVFVIATSDESPQRRRLAAFTATSIAEFFRERGRKVLLLIDSLTRTARAMREMGLAAGELPVRQGYTPSVYTALPKLLERSGNSDRGSITAIYSVLTTNGGEDPLEEEITSLLDGHLKLDQEVALKGIRPALDVLNSISRVMPALHTEKHLANIALTLRLLGRLKRDRDMLLFGGTPDHELACAVRFEAQLRAFQHQGVTEATEYHTAVQRFDILCDEIRTYLGGEGK